MSETQTIEIVVLRIRGQPKRVTWHESVIDNEHMNKRKSNKCCIFHRQHAFSESESEDETSDED